MELKKNYSIADILAADNVADIISEEDLKSLGKEVVTRYDEDDKTREEWREQYQEAWKLALQIREPKTQPWPGCSNVKFPLLTIACLQFQSRAYPALITGPDVVKVRVIGDDADGSKGLQADRVSQFMSWQLLEEDQNWEEDTDRLLMTLPIVGCVIRKSYYDAVRDHNCSEMVMPEDFVVSYYTKSLEKCPRATHVLHYSPREIKAKQIGGVYRECELGPPNHSDTISPTESERQQERGFTEPQSDPEAPRDVLEQHTYFDLDGDDYAEPYVITVDRVSQEVLRIFPRYSDGDIKRNKDDQIRSMASQAMQMMSQPLPPDPTQAQAEMVIRHQQAQAIEDEIQKLKASSTIIHIEPISYFTKYPFIPAPDGAFYDLGFGALLGPVNHAVDTIINQLIDAGSLQNSNVGFLGSAIRVRGGDYRFRPFEWKKTDAPAGSLKDNVLPLPINQPSTVLFELLQLLINYGERISSVNDIMVGETPGQNTPASTTQLAFDQGMKVFSGILKRLYRSLKQEYQKLYRLNRVYMDPQEYFTILSVDQPGVVFQQDFQGDPRSVAPEADPTLASDGQKIQRISFLMQRSQVNGGYDKNALEVRMLKDMRIPDIKTIYPPLQPQPDPELSIKAAAEARKTLEANVQARAQLAEADAKVINLKAQALMYLAQAQATADQVSIDKIRVQMEGLDAVHDALFGMMDQLTQQQALQQEQQNGPTGASNAGGSG